MDHNMVGALILDSTGSTPRTSTAGVLPQEQKEVRLRHRCLGPTLNIHDRLCGLIYSIFSCTKDLESYQNPAVAQMLCYLDFRNNRTVQLGTLAETKSSISTKGLQQSPWSTHRLAEDLTRIAIWGKLMALSAQEQVLPTVAMSRCLEITKNRANTTRCFPWAHSPKLDAASASFRKPQWIFHILT